jgi:hypothetical protein
MSRGLQAATLADLVLAARRAGDMEVEAEAYAGLARLCRQAGAPINGLLCDAEVRAAEMDQPDSAD